jgi:hypothetical protein
LQALFAQEAEKYHVYPLQNTTFARAVAPQPSPLAGQTVYTYSGEISGIPTDDAPSIIGKSYTITADVNIPEGGGEGMIVTEGGRWGRFGLYLLRPIFNSLKN